MYGIGGWYVSVTPNAANILKVPVYVGCLSSISTSAETRVYSRSTFRF